MRTKSAFTLIELLIVIIIIGLLASIAVASFTKAEVSARDNARKTTVNSISVAIEAYYRDNHTFPGLATGVASDKNICQQLDSTGNISYSYYPLLNGCSGISGVTSTAGSFSPAPNWIPGLGNYMSPVAIDKRFLNSAGDTYDTALAASSSFVSNTVEPIGEMWTDADSTRTYTYRNLGSGYIIYTRLEGTNTTPFTNTVSVFGSTLAEPDIYAIMR